MHGVMRLHSTAAWTEEDAREVRERKAAVVVAMVRRRALFFVVDIFSSLSLLSSETAALWGVE